MEWSQGDIIAARQLFTRGTAVPQVYQHPPLYEAWSRLEAEAGDTKKAQELVAQSLALESRKRVKQFGRSEPNGLSS